MPKKQKGSKKSSQPLEIRDAEAQAQWEAAKEVIREQEVQVAVATLQEREAEAQVVHAIAVDLTSLPEYAKLQQAFELQAKVDEMDAEVSRMLGGKYKEKFPELQLRIAKLQGQLAQKKTEKKNEILSDPSITVKRAAVAEKFRNWLDKSVEAAVESMPSVLKVQNELTEALALAKRVQEIRQRANELETESQSLLSAVNL
jgi:hypothetical protein